jgi:hypothetical protein
LTGAAASHAIVAAASALLDLDPGERIVWIWLPGRST